jgi:hypothetical protein
MPLSVFDMIDSVTSRRHPVRCGKSSPGLFPQAGRRARIMAHDAPGWKSLHAQFHVL